MKRYVLACAILLGSVLAAHHARADVATIGFSALATATDNGEQDGIFDGFVPGNLGSINNNGFTSFRTAAEFDLLALPTGATITSAVLTSTLTNSEGDPRFIEMHGFMGDGTVGLGDFALNGLVGSSSVGVGTFILTYDVTGFISGLLSNSNTFAGFNWREDPANASNFLVMQTDVINGPRLSIEFTTTPIPEPEIYAMLGMGLGLMGFAARRRRQQAATV